MTTTELLFHERGSLFGVFQAQELKLIETARAIPADHALATSTEQLAADLVERFRIEALVIDWDAMTLSSADTMVDVSGDPRRFVFPRAGDHHRHPSDFPRPIQRGGRPLPIPAINLHLQPAAWERGRRRAAPGRRGANRQPRGSEHNSTPRSTRSRPTSPVARVTLRAGTTGSLHSLGSTRRGAARRSSATRSSPPPSASNYAVAKTRRRLTSSPRCGARLRGPLPKEGVARLLASQSFPPRTMSGSSTSAVAWP